MIGEAVEAGIDAASEAVSALPRGQKAWSSKEYMIAETAARAAISAHLEALERAGLVVAPAAVGDLVDAARRWRRSLRDDGWSEDDIRHIARPGLHEIIRALDALDVAPPPQNSDEVKG